MGDVIKGMSVACGLGECATCVVGCEDCPCHAAGNTAKWDRGLAMLGTALEGAGLVVLKRRRDNKVIYTVKGGEVVMCFIKDGRPPGLELHADDGYGVSWDVTRGVPRATKFLQMVRTVMQP